MPPIVIYPEGGTTNGDSLLQFKKGAFAGLHSVQPIAMQYKTSMIQANALNLNIFAHFIVMMSMVGCVLKIKEYPVFKPNDYFFKHH